MEDLKYEYTEGDIDGNDLFQANGDLALMMMDPYSLQDAMNPTALLPAPLPPPFFPVSPVGPPERYAITGLAQFVVQINSTEIKKKKYLYSHRLNRIFVEENTPVCTEFNWNRHCVSNTLYVRATVVFADQAQAEKRVETCVQHHQAAKAAGKMEVVARNVLNSSRVASSSSDVYYCGDPDNQESWLSVVVKFVKRSDEPCRHAYQFICKNSCSSGINRRAIDIIFTLEDESGVILGRQSVGARVCACPIRDLRRDEAELPADSTQSKKRRIDNHHDMPLLPQLPIANLDAVKMAFRSAVEMMEHVAPLHADNPQAKENYRISIAAFKKYLGDLKKPPRS